ncbi:hypothetical protein [Belliella buryatensis]|nr:hypothetical protein [Belliella buryatensis]
MLKVKISKILTFLVLVSVFYANGIAMGTSSLIGDIELKIKPASNSEGFLVMEKQDWESFKIRLENDLSQFSKKQDSLNRIIRQQSDSLMRWKTIRTVEPIVESSSRQSNVFPWTLCIILVILGLIALSYIFNANNKIHDTKERYQNLEDQYESSKRHWIDKERQFKRMLIDLNNRIEELEQDSTE